MTADSTPAKSQSSIRKWFLIGTAVFVAILFFTNPDQAMHLKAINEAVELRFPNTPYGSNYTRMTGVIQYHNYGLFSTTGFIDMTFSYGFLGRVQTTNGISYVATGVIPR